MIQDRSQAVLGNFLNYSNTTA